MTKQATPDMIERVARAIYEANDPTRDDPLCVTLHDSEFISGETVDEQLAEVMEICRSAARAAIEAMREPTEAMLRSAFEEHVPAFDAIVAWRAMIDAALATQNTED